MKIIAITLKDMTRSFRSAFALVFMFAIPLLVTGMFYLMFGGQGTRTDGGFELPVTRVILVNLDAGDPQAGQLGKIVADALASPDFASLMQVTTTSDAPAARQAVDAGQAGAAVIIPADFSAAFTDPTAAAVIEFYQDPTLSVGPGIVRAVLSQFTDQFAGIKITVNLALRQAEAGQIGYDQVGQLIEGYLSTAPTGTDPQTLLEVRTPQAARPTNQLLTMIGSIMAGMMIFYAFYTGMSSAESILREHEEGTLQRLFTTPTRQSQALAGKFLAVGLTVLVQVVVLLILARLIFGIRWGSLPAVALSVLAIVCSASAFGVLVCSLLKNTRQGGIIFGGLLTVTGMVGMIDIFTGNAASGNFGIVPLLTPQGWASRAMLLSMQGASVVEVSLYALVLLVISAAFFFAGVWRFQKRYA